MKPTAYSVVRWSEGGLPDSVRLRQTLIDEHYDVIEWSDNAGTAYEMHSHLEDQSHWIISGSLELTIYTGDKFILEPGDRDFMPAGIQHSARVVGDNAVRYLIGSRR